MKNISFLPSSRLMSDSYLVKSLNINADFKYEYRTFL